MMTLTRIASTTALAGVLALGTAMPTIAQDDGMSSQNGQSSMQNGQSSAESGQGTTQQDDEMAMAGFDDDAVVASVDGNDITAGEVRATMATLPARVASQPVSQVAAMTLDQLVLEELILARATGDDPVADEQLDEAMSQDDGLTREDALISAWVRRELDRRVDDETIARLYGQLQGRAEAEGRQMPPMEQVRPQLQQAAWRQALGEIRTDLREDATVTLYDEDGKPREGGSASSG